MKAETVAVRDQILAVLRDRGPLVTKEVAQSLPARRRYYVTCGHADCERPEHTRGGIARSFYTGDAYQQLAALHQKGLVDRTPLDSSRPTLWWIST